MGHELLMDRPEPLWERKTKHELDREAARASDFYAAQRERDDPYDGDVD